MNKEPIRVFRPVAEQSLPSLHKLHAASEVFPRHNIRILDEPHTTIIERFESRPYIGHPLNNRKRGLRLQLHPLPEHSERTLTMPVVDVRYLGKRMYRRALALILDDPLGIIASERDEYLRRMEKTLGKGFMPHVSVINVDPGLATSDLLEWAQAKAPKVITLDQLTSWPKVDAPPQMQKQNRVKVTPPHSEPKPLASVINLGVVPKIPQAFINSIQGEQTPEVSNT